MARIWTNYSTDGKEIIDLTSKETEETEEYQLEEDLLALTHRQTAICKYVWDLDREERSLLSVYFMNSIKASKFFELLSDDRRFNERLQVNHMSFITNYINCNHKYLKNLLEEQGDFWLLISCRVNYKSDFYQCLVKRGYNLSDQEEKVTEL